MAVSLSCNVPHWGAALSPERLIDGSRTHLVDWAHVLATPATVNPASAAPGHPLLPTTATTPAAGIGAATATGETWDPTTCPVWASLLRAVTLWPFPAGPEPLRTLDDKCVLFISLLILSLDLINSHLQPVVVEILAP